MLHNSRDFKKNSLFLSTRKAVNCVRDLGRIERKCEKIIASYVIQEELLSLVQ